jgi:hypothetical protein
MKSYILFFIAIPFNLWAQQPVQTLRGVVKDLETETVLPGANILIYQNGEYLNGTVSDMDGQYRMENIPVGRIEVRARYVGYKDFLASNLNITSGKEFILDILLEESAMELEGVTITANRKGEVINEMATVSVRSFTVEETDRYAGSRGDPARMASNFAGVQGADDSRNDLVVRGNSPIGVLWRLENIDIPNPNHFAIAGTTGGPVAIINNKYLANSDFFTGAFPAEYGNATAGVFDLHMRKGNDETYEFSGQIGFLGTELFAEGPLNKEKKSSFLLSYRYSTLQLFQSLNIQIGTSAVPRYQDAAFKLHFPLENGSLSFFGVGGLSDIDILVSDYETPEELELYGDSDRDQYFGTSMAMTGMNYGHKLGERTIGKATLAFTWQDNHADHVLVNRDSLFNITSMVPNMGYFYRDKRYIGAYTIQTKLDNRNLIKYGVVAESVWYHHLDSNLNLLNGEFDNRYDYNDGAWLFRAYAQWKHKFTDRFFVVSGLHGLWFTLNDQSKALEPRVSMQYSTLNGHVFTAGGGLHSQTLPSYQYTYRVLQDNGDYDRINEDVGLFRSVHAVAGHAFAFTDAIRLKTEIYYQHLYDIPVEETPSAFSLANEGSGFARFFPGPLENTGTGRNYGVELTLEKLFSDQYFFLVTGSLFDSRYVGSDGVERPTNFNGRYAANLVGGKLFRLGEGNNLNVSTKLTWVGGRLTSPVDTAATIAVRELVFIDSLTNTIRLKDYFRADIRIAYQINTRSTTHELAIDLVNLFNVQNVLGLTYAPNPTDPSVSPVREAYQLGFLPIFYYKIDF